MIKFIERSSNQSNFQKVFVINLMSVQLPFDYIPLLFDYIRFMKILHLPFFFLLLLLFSLNKKYNKKKRNELFPLWKLRNMIGCLKNKKIKKIWLAVSKALFWAFSRQSRKKELTTSFLMLHTPPSDEDFSNFGLLNIWLVQSKKKNLCQNPFNNTEQIICMSF